MSSIKGIFIRFGASDKKHQQAPKERLSERAIACILESCEKPAIHLLNCDHGLHGEGPARWLFLMSLDYPSRADHGRS